MENTEHSKIAFLAFVFPHTNIPSCSSEDQPRAMQAAESQGCSQANSWLIEIILKVGWDWTKQSKSLFKPTQICLYLYEIVNWVLKDFRLLLYWLMFQIFLLPVLKSCLLPILIKCSLCGSAAQAHPATCMGESSVPLIWSQLHKVTWEGQPGPGQGSVLSPTRFPLQLVQEAGEEGGGILSCCQSTAWAQTLQSLYTSVHPGVWSSREMKPNWAWGRRGPCPVLAGAAQLGWQQLTWEGSGSSCSWGRKVRKLLHPHLPELCPVPSCHCFSIISSHTSTASDSKLIP